MTTEVVSVGVAAPSAAYGCHLPHATRFVDDAAGHLRAVAGAVRGRLTELLGVAATCAAVAEAIRAAAERLRGAPAGLFVLAFAGHGGRLTDTDGDDGDGIDESWALDDAPLTDDVLTSLLGEFHRDVHVVLISNCCFSAGMLDEPRPARPATAPSLPTNRVVIASCGAEQMMVLPDSSRLTARVLDTVFPLDTSDGPLRQRQAVDYAALERRVAAMASVSQTPVVMASALDMQRLAFVPQPLVPP